MLGDFPSNRFIRLSGKERPSHKKVNWKPESEFGLALQKWKAAHLDRRDAQMNRPALTGNNMPSAI